MGVDIKWLGGVLVDWEAYTRAVSMWRYPAFRASETAFSWASASCQVPKPRAGIVAPVLSLKVVISMVYYYSLGLIEVVKLKTALSVRLLCYIAGYCGRW